VDAAVVDPIRLGAHLTALLRPREVSDGDEEEGVAVVEYTSEGVVPSQEGRSQAEAASSVNEGWPGGAANGEDVAKRKEQEGHVQRKKQKEEGHR